MNGAKVLEIGDLVVIDPEFCDNNTIRQFDGVELRVLSKGRIQGNTVSQWTLTYRDDADRHRYPDNSYNFTYTSRLGNPGEIHWMSSRVRLLVKKYELDQKLDEAEDLL